MEKASGNKYKIISIILAIALVLAIAVPIYKNHLTKPDDSKTEDPVKEELITDDPISCKDVKYFSGITKKEGKTNVVFDVNYFKDPATEYNQDLAELSAVASATAYLNRDRLSYKEGFSYYQYQFLRQMGFENIDIQNYGFSEGKSDKVGYTFAEKKVLIESREITLVAVIIRGTTAGEWLSNFYISGDENFKAQEKHRGFALAANNLDLNLEKYLKSEKIKLKSADTKIWITGHSRGAAVANLVAADLTARYGNERVYAYTFATPNVTRNPNLIDGETDNDYFKNIINFVSDQDFVPQVPLNKEKWNYDKNGTTVLFDSSDKAIMSKMKSEFGSLTDKKYNSVTKKETDQVIKDMGSLSPDVPAYYKGEKYFGLTMWGEYKGFTTKPKDFFDAVGKYLIYDGYYFDDKKKRNNASNELSAYYISDYKNPNSKYYQSILTYLKDKSKKVAHSHSPETYISFIRAMDTEN